MFKPSELRRLPRDGYRVRLVEHENRLLIYIALVAHGKVIRRKRVWKCEPTPPKPIHAYYAEQQRRGKLLAAILRSLNEGADIHEVSETYLSAQRVSELFAADVAAGLQLVGLETEERHSRTFVCPDGNYLCVVEDDFAEELTPMQMQQLMDEAAEADLGELPELPGFMQ